MKTIVIALVALAVLGMVVAPTMADHGVGDGDGIPNEDGTGAQNGNPGNFNEDGDHDGLHEPGVDWLPCI